MVLQWTPISVVSNIWHVLDVPPNSPADQACLFPYSDWILGTPDGTLHGEGGLGELVEDHIDRPVRLWVYNNEYNVTREVTITPSRGWGGEGALGCMLGYGALHRLPAPLSEPVNEPGETMFDGEANSGITPDSFLPTAIVGTPLSTGDVLPSPPMAAVSGTAAGDFLVPAQMVAPGRSPPLPRSHAKSKRKHHSHTGPDMMDNYFKEEEKKSRELDNAPKSSGNKGLPPPPKAGDLLKTPVAVTEG